MKNKAKLIYVCKICGTKKAYFIYQARNPYKYNLYCENDHFIEESGYIPHDNFST